jgi:4'-phosphopantetheinyl transferase
MTGWVTRWLADIPAGDEWLGPSERRAQAKLSIEKRRIDWRLGRYTAKVAVCAWLGVEPERVEVPAAPGGAPVALLDGRSAEVELSISHRAGRALAVVASPGMPVGCDLELIEPRSAAFVREWLAPSEQRLLENASHDERAFLANLLWSAKEASTKARGEGLRLDVRHAEVVLDTPTGNAGDWLALHVGWGSDRDRGWFRREPRWVMTVVGGGTGAPRAQPARPTTVTAVRT